MNMPGFAAEASLYKTSGHYCTAAIWGDSTAVSLMEPAQLIPRISSDGGVWGPCVQVAPGVWQHENLRTGRTEPCTPTAVCVSCLPDPSSPTTCSGDCFFRDNPNLPHFRGPCICPPPISSPPPPLEGSMGCGLPPECAGSSIVSTDTHCIGVIEFCQSKCQVPSSTHPGEMETKSGSWCPCGLCFGFW
jgi:hypothetical protein